MLGIALDVVALWAIASFLAKQNMWEEWRRFALFALGLIAVGGVLFFAEVHAVVAFGGICHDLLEKTRRVLADIESTRPSSLDPAWR